MKKFFLYSLSTSSSAMPNTAVVYDSVVEGARCFGTICNLALEAIILMAYSFNFVSADFYFCGVKLSILLETSDII